MMELRELAETVLFGQTLADKLIIPDATQLRDERPGSPLARIPEFPARPAELAQRGRAEFPRDFERDEERGRVLHFFANHELLAMELMALALLRFPDAPAAWRRGIGGTLLEEAEHMRLYQQRMSELGVEFGALPVNGFFWDALKDMRSPLDFVTQMGLTFEQANLDYCVHYREAMRQVGDQATVDVLQRVYEDEIGHVQLGAQWFDEWREPGLDQWDAYQQLLPPPLTAVRARGIGFDVEGRRRAGLEARFIEELAVLGGGRGPRPVLRWLDAGSEYELAAEVLPTAATALSQDLASLPMLLAAPGDVVWCDRPPTARWLHQWSALGLRPPAFVADVDALPAQLERCEPWAWSPRAVALAARLSDLRIASPDGAAYAQAADKRWLAGEIAACLDDLHDQWLDRTVPVTATTREAALAAIDGRACMLKAPLGTAGRSCLRVTEVTDSVRAWIDRTLVAQRAVLVEPLHQRCCDLGALGDVRDGSVRFLGIRRHLVDEHGRYTGTVLGRKLQAERELLRFLHGGDAGRSPLAVLEHICLRIGQRLAGLGHVGGYGIDAYVYRDDTGLYLRPLVECNPRCTMGRIALASERFIADGVPATFTIEPHTTQLPDPVLADGRLRDGALSLTDPAQARRVIVVLRAGSAVVVPPVASPIVE